MRKSSIVGRRSRQWVELLLRSTSSESNRHYHYYFCCNCIMSHFVWYEREYISLPAARKWLSTVRRGESVQRARINFKLRGDLSAAVLPISGLRIHPPTFNFNCQLKSRFFLGSHDISWYFWHWRNDCLSFWSSDGGGRSIVVISIVKALMTLTERNFWPPQPPSSVQFKVQVQDNSFKKTPHFDCQSDAFHTFELHTSRSM